MNTDFTFYTAVAAYLAQADYLTVEDMPQIVALKEAAATLDAQAADSGVQANLLNAFCVTFRDLRKRKAGDSEGVSEGEAFLASL